MLRYALGTLGALILAAFVLFGVMAWRNARDDHPGPAPKVLITATASAISPDQLALEEDRLVELVFINNGPLLMEVTTNSGDVEQLPTDTDFRRPEGNQSRPVPYIKLQAGAGGVATALVRFKRAGTYELRVQVPGRDETRLVAAVVVS